METKATGKAGAGLFGGRSPLLRLQSDDKLIALIRSGNEAAFEQLFDRYRPRLMAFCRHMLGSKEDAEDVMQEVFVNAYNAIRADDREINAKPWLYRIARNRSLNHLRKPVPDGQDTMDEYIGESGNSTADIAHKRADLRHLLEDVQKLPESQRTALLMREVDVLSYDQIAEAMETTVPSVKSLLVRARMSLAEAKEARALSCDDVRLQLAEATEGIRKITPPVKRHMRECEECAQYRKMLRKTNTAMALALPVGTIMTLKKLFAAKLGLAALGGGAKAGTGAAATGGVAAGSAAATGSGAVAGAGAGALITKAAVGVALTALVAGGAVEANKVVHKHNAKPATTTEAVAPVDTTTTGGVSAQQAETAIDDEEAAEDKTAKDEAKTDTASDTTTPDDSSSDSGSSGSPGSGDQVGSPSGGSSAGSGSGSSGGSSGSTGSGTGNSSSGADVVPSTGGSPSGSGGSSSSPTTIDP